MSEVLTTLEAQVDPERVQELVRVFERVGGDLPPQIVESFLLHDDEMRTWRIVTLWRSREDLHAYRDSVDTAEGVKMFRAVDAEPTLTIFDVAARVSQ